MTGLKRIHHDWEPATIHSISGTGRNSILSFCAAMSVTDEVLIAGAFVCPVCKVLKVPLYDGAYHYFAPNGATWGTAEPPCGAEYYNYSIGSNVDASR